MVEQVLKLREKSQLSANDAFTVVQLLQEQALPIFSLRNASVQSNTSSLSSQPTVTVQNRHSQAGRRRERISPSQTLHKVNQRSSPFGSSTSYRTSTDVKVTDDMPIQLDDVDEFPPIGSAATASCTTRWATPCDLLLCVPVCGVCQGKTEWVKWRNCQNNIHWFIKLNLTELVISSTGVWIYLTVTILIACT